MDSPIYVTRPYLPELSEFTKYMEQIWENKILTNDGPFHQQLEAALADYLGVKYVSVFSNGTLALITALQALDIDGEVITTPFSFPATTHSLVWNRLTPVFCDIEPETYNIDPDQIEKSITARTRAIVPVHVYGNPCDVERIQWIASKHNLRVVYDSAHAFGVKCGGRSILNFGDLSVLSFHATKIFNTFEGGAVICHDPKTKQKIDFLKNHGFYDETTIVTPGINAKMNEIQAAMGLLQLRDIDERIQKLRQISSLYREILRSTSGIGLLNDIDNVQHNYSYFPVTVNESVFGISRDKLYEGLKEYNIFSRRYFFPLISNFPAYEKIPSAALHNLPVANKISAQVLCLPNYADLPLNKVSYICDCIAQIQSKYAVVSNIADSSGE